MLRAKVLDIPADCPIFIKVSARFDRRNNESKDNDFHHGGDAGVRGVGDEHSP